MILIDSEQLTEMMADNDIAPYVFIKVLTKLTPSITLAPLSSLQ